MKSQSVGRDSADDKPSFELENCQDYAGALRIVASARSFFLLLLIVSLATHAGAYSISRWKTQWINPGAMQPTQDKPVSPAATLVLAQAADEPVVSEEPLNSRRPGSRLVHDRDPARYEKVVRPEGFEPSTSASAGPRRRSLWVPSGHFSSR